MLAGARRVFLERGYAGATLDAIADEAGFSKGVVYSQFAGKPDLFLALLEQRIAERAEENARNARDRAGLDGLRTLLQANARITEEGGDWSRLLIEFRLVAARDPALNDRYAALHARTVEHFAGTVAAVLARGGVAPAYPMPVFAELILAFGTGMVLEHAAGNAHVRPEHLIELLGRALVPLGTDEKTVSNTPLAGGHDAHDDRTEALVPRDS